MHYFFVEDASGDLVDLVPFCSDSCHQQWCADQGEAYEGWNGCQAPADYAEVCASCGDLIHESQDEWVVWAQAGES